MNMKKSKRNESQACRTQFVGNAPEINRREGSGYRRKFLKNMPQSGRIQVYLDRSLYECIKRFLPAIAPGVSLSSYISNIVADHVEQYIDEINIRYYKSFSPIDLNKVEGYDD